MTATAPSSHHLGIHGLTHHYLSWGESAASAVVLLHGLRSYAYTWDRLARTLADSHYLVAPDFRGRGDSAWDPVRNYYLDTYLADLEELVSQLGLGRFAVIGHSLGGAVGYAYAARHPEHVTKLIVEDIGPGSSTHTAGADRILRELGDVPTTFDSLDDVRAYWRRIRPDIADEALDSRVRNTVRPGPGGRWEWKLDMQGIAEARRNGDPGRSPDLWSCVDALQCPTLVIRGGASDFLAVETCEQLTRRQPLIRWVEVPAAGHYVHDDNPEAVIDLVTDFLAGTAGRVAP
ncbi:MAG TPA: alpha/beta hydrolase [Kineosporiaceae bacterium]